MNIATACAGLLALLPFALGLAVSIERGRRGIFIGHPNDPGDRLYRLVRAHGNCTEYVPLLVAICLFLAVRGSSAFLDAVMIWATVARLFQAAGLFVGSSMARTNIVRFVGGLSTYLAGLILAGALIFKTGL